MVIVTNTACTAPVPEVYSVKEHMLETTGFSLELKNCTRTEILEEWTYTVNKYGCYGYYKNAN